MASSATATASAFLTLAEVEPPNLKGTIKIRVVTKSPINDFFNAKSKKPGKHFSMEIADDSGKLKLVAFDRDCDTFYRQFTIGQIYTIDKAAVKINPFPAEFYISNYQIQLSKFSKVMHKEDNPKFAPIIINYTQLRDIQKLKQDANINIIGFITATTDVEDFFLSRTNKTLPKIDIELKDMSTTGENQEVTLTLWNNTAKKVNPAEHRTIQVVGGKVSHFGGGISITTNTTTQIVFNPDIEKARQLIEHFKKPTVEIRDEQ